MLAAGSIFDPLYKVVGWLLAFLYVPLHSLGLAIIVMTLIVMAVQLPLIAKQTRSMILMQRVQPEIKKIQQKYKDDRQKQNEELLKFYQENKINPLAGCLPLLVILPIGIAVLGTFRHGGLPKHVPQSGTFNKLYTDLCTVQGKLLQPDPCNTYIRAHPKNPPAVLKFLGMNLNLSAAEGMKEGLAHALPYLVVLAIVIFTGWYQVRQTQARQQKQGAAAPNAQMQTITKIMPVFFGLISYGFSAATTIYFAVSNLWRIGQQHFVLNKMYEEEGLLGGSGGGKGSAAKSPPVTPAKGDPSKATDPPAGNGSDPSRPSPNAARRKKKRKR